MKKVNGLSSAMRIVESACEKGEITIIGEGAMPSPQELLVKCAKFVEKQFGVSVKMLAIVGNHAVAYGTACPDCEDEVDEDIEDEDEVDEDEIACFDCLGIEEYLDDMLYDRLDQIAEGLVEDAIHNIRSVYEDLNGELCERLDSEDIVDDICDALDAAIPCISEDKAREIAKDIEDYICDHYFEAK